MRWCVMNLENSAVVDVDADTSKDAERKALTAHGFRQPLTMFRYPEKGEPKELIPERPQ